jgi:hypothetical protein
LFNLTVLSSLRYQLPRLFTKDEEVIAIVASVLPLCAVMQVFDCHAAISRKLKFINFWFDIDITCLLEQRILLSGCFPLQAQAKPL